MAKLSMEKTKEFMDGLSAGIDQCLNPGRQKGEAPLMGFTLLVFPFNDLKEGMVNYASNAERKDMIVAMKAIVARLEGTFIENTGAKH